MTTPAGANSERQLKVEQLHSIIFDLRHKLQECKIQVRCRIGSSIFSVQSPLEDMTFEYLMTAAVLRVFLTFC